MSKSKPLPKWLVKASWRATAKLFHVRARTAEGAWEKGVVNKEAYGAMDVVVIGKINE